MVKVDVKTLGGEPEHLCEIHTYLYISDTGWAVTEETKCVCVAIKLTHGMDMP